MSNARSPREVCSITIGINGLMAVTPQAESPWLLPAGGPQFRLGLGGFLVGGPDLLARAGGLARDALHLGRDPVERLPQPQVAAQRFVAAAGEHLLDGLVGIVVVQLGLLADQLLDLLVGDLEPELVGDRLEDELARDRELRLRTEPLDELLAALARELEVRLRADDAALERAPERVQQLPSPRPPERDGGPEVRSLDERVDRGRAELRLRLLLEHLANAPLDVLAQLGEGVELACGTCEVVVQRRQHLLLQLLQRHRGGAGRALRHPELDPLRLAGRGARQRALDLLDEPPGAELDDQVALAVALAGGVTDVDHDDVSRLRRTALDGCELGHP